jgi:hypothetical protein
MPTPAKRFFSPTPPATPAAGLSRTRHSADCSLCKTRPPWSLPMSDVCACDTCSLCTTLCQILGRGTLQGLDLRTSMAPMSCPWVLCGHGHLPRSPPTHTHARNDQGRQCNEYIHNTVPPQLSTSLQEWQQHSFVGELSILLLQDISALDPPPSAMSQQLATFL